MLVVVLAHPGTFVRVVSAIGSVVPRPTTRIEFVIPEDALQEPIPPDHRAIVLGAIASGTLRCTRLESSKGLTACCELRDMTGLGEAACIAFGLQHPDGIIVTDTCRTFRRIAQERLGADRVLTVHDLVSRLAG